MTKDEVMALIEIKINNAKIESKIFVGNDRSMEDWKVTIYDELLCDSKHYETCGITYHLDEYNAYYDKGNKIEGEYITLTKKEYDNIK